MRKRPRHRRVTKLDQHQHQPAARRSRGLVVCSSAWRRPFRCRRSTGAAGAEFMGTIPCSDGPGRRQRALRPGARRARLAAGIRRGFTFTAGCHRSARPARQRADPRAAGAALRRSGMSVPLRERTKLRQGEAAARVAELNHRSRFALTTVNVRAPPIKRVAGLLGMNVGGVPFTDEGPGCCVVATLIARPAPRRPKARRARLIRRSKLRRSAQSPAGRVPSPRRPSPAAHRGRCRGTRSRGRASAADQTRCGHRR